MMKSGKNDLADKIKGCRLLDEQTGIWYLGQEGFLFKNKNKYLAIDPYLSDYVDRNCCEFVKWSRLYPPPISGDELSFVNVVLCTHSHYDHADPVTLKEMFEANKELKIVAPAPCLDTVAEYGIDKENIIPAKAFESIEVDGFEVIPVPSAHEELHQDENGDYLELGYVIKVKENSQTYFHAGDMCMYDGLEESLKKYDIDIAFLPINGRDYFRNAADIIGNFNCEEAVLLAKNINAEMLVPMHHDLYEVNCVRPEEFVSAVNKHHPFRKYHIFSPGELYISGKN